MKPSALLLPLLAVLPLSAQDWEAGVFLGRQSFKAPSAADGLGDQVTYNPQQNRPAYGLRVGRSLVDLGPVLLQITAGYQQAASTEVVSTGVFRLSEPTTTTGPLTTRSYAVGAMFTLHSFVSVGAGLDYRFENYQYQGQSTTASRPWARVDLGYAFPSPVVKPFVGVEADFPLASTTLALPPAGDNVLKAMAPKSQFGLYLGVRF